MSECLETQSKYVSWRSGVIFKEFFSRKANLSNNNNLMVYSHMYRKNDYSSTQGSFLQSKSVYKMGVSVNLYIRFFYSEWKFKSNILILNKVIDDLNLFQDEEDIRSRVASLMSGDDEDVPMTSGAANVSKDKSRTDLGLIINGNAHASGNGGNARKRKQIFPKLLLAPPIFVHPNPTGVPLRRTPPTSPTSPTSSPSKRPRRLPRPIVTTANTTSRYFI